MSHETAPTQPAARAPSAEKQALLEAFDTVLKHQAEARKAEAREAKARRRARGRARPLIWMSGGVTLVLCSYLLVERPGWLFPQGGPPESGLVQEASLRIGMANAAQHVQRYRQQNDRLPQSLAEAGAHGEGIQYVRIGETAWRMTAIQGISQLTLTSGDDLGEFIGKSFEVISRRTP